MKKKIKVRKVLKDWRNLPLEVSYKQVVRWVASTPHTGR